jgi:N-acetylglutamate synthase-like GNAT family acetyltransferase
MNCKKITEADKSWVKEIINNYWSGEPVVVHNKKYYPTNLNGYKVEINSKKIGLATYLIINGKCEIVTLNSIIENKGVGTLLVNTIINEAISKKCKSVWLITTNDNLRAIDFYKKRGFKLTDIYHNAVAKSRIIKPEIPLTGVKGIPINDELKFELII